MSFVLLHTLFVRSHSQIMYAAVIFFCHYTVIVEHVAVKIYGYALTAAVCLLFDCFAGGNCSTRREFYNLMAD